MKTLFLFGFVAISSISYSQTKQDYVRSSLNMILVDDFNFEGGEFVLKSYEKFEFPENYNNHNTNIRKVKLSNYELSKEELDAAGRGDGLLGNALSEITSESTNGLLKIQDNSMVQLQLDKFIKENKLAHSLVRKWWNIDTDGNFNNNLVNERSLQTLTTEMDALANSSGTGQIDQFNKLINNTFVVFTRLYYVQNAFAAEGIRQQAYKVAEKLTGLPRQLAEKAADKIYDKTSEGFSVWATAWLYQLDWNEEIFNRFTLTIKQDGKIDIEKLNELELKINYIGQEKATSLVTFSLKQEDKGRTDQDIFDLATVRNMSKVLVKLQRENDVFKPIFPLKEGFAMAAGTKEGIEGGEEFEVLESKDGEYNRIGTMKVDNKKIWDNSWTGEDIKPGLTYFQKGNKKFVPGIHYVRLIK